MKILVTGSTGFLGRNIIPVLKREFPGDTIAVLPPRTYDLRDPLECDLALQGSPDVVVNLAGKVGGIIANRDYPADFCYENLLITTNIFKSAQRNGVKKLLMFIGGCSYPFTAPVPIFESSMWDGRPAGEAAPFSLAKRMTIVLSEAFRKQYGLNSVVLIPGNLYGPFDNFSLEYSHVIPAIIRKMYNAKLRGEDLTLFGSGAPIRDFLYIQDLAEMIPYFIRGYDSSEPINLSSGIGVTIREVARLVRAAMRYDGRILWDTTQPEGHQVKVFGISKMHGIADLPQPSTDISIGIARTVDWFLSNLASSEIRL